MLIRGLFKASVVVSAFQACYDKFLSELGQKVGLLKQGYKAVLGLCTHAPCGIR